MFTYRGCRGIKAKAHCGGYFWMITFEDGTRDMASTLKLAKMLCDKELRRADM